MAPSRPPIPGRTGQQVASIDEDREPDPPRPRRGLAAPRLPRTFEWSDYAWIAGALVALALAVLWLGPVLTPFVTGAILAYLGTPLVDALARRRVPRVLGTTLVVLLMVVLLVALFLVVVPLIVAEVSSAIARVPELITRANDVVVPWMRETLGLELALDLATLRAIATENLNALNQVALKLLAGVRIGGVILLSIVINLVLIPVIAFYLMRDWNGIVSRIDGLVPRRWKHKVRIVARDIDKVLAEFLRGQIMVMAVLAAFYALGLWAVGLNNGVSIGILTGILGFIPYLGYGLGLVLGLIAALLQWSGWGFFLAVVAVYMVGQLLENYVLLPNLVGDRIGLHPVAVIFALLAFGQLFGFVGVLLALPVSAALLVALRHLRAAYLASPLYRDH